MKLKNVLIVVKDIEKARQFYQDLFEKKKKKKRKHDPDGRTGPAG